MLLPKLQKHVKTFLISLILIVVVFGFYMVGDAGWNNINSSIEPQSEASLAVNDSLPNPTPDSKQEAEPISTTDTNSQSLQEVYMPVDGHNGVVPTVLSDIHAIATPIQNTQNPEPTQDQYQAMTEKIKQEQAARDAFCAEIIVSEVQPIKTKLTEVNSKLIHNREDTIKQYRGAFINASQLEAIIEKNRNELNLQKWELEDQLNALRQKYPQCIF